MKNKPRNRIVEGINMNKITPILTLIIIVTIVSVSGCISVVNPENTSQEINNIVNNSNQVPDSSENSANISAQNVNKSGNIQNTSANSDKMNQSSKASKSNDTGDNHSSIDGITPKITPNDARKIMDKELKTNYSIDNAVYTISGYVENGTPYYNISIEKFDEKTSKNTVIGNAIMNANTGEIINNTLEKAAENRNNNEKVYSVDEAGKFVDITYKGEKVSVRENYPYYSPQNGKVYHSREEEAEDLYQLSKAIKNE